MKNIFVHEPDTAKSAGFFWPVFLIKNFERAYMTGFSDKPIEGTAAFSLISAALGALFVAPRALAAVGFGGRIDGALNYGRAGLRQNRGSRFRHSILRQGVIGQNRRREGRNLHIRPSETPLVEQLLRRQNEEIIKDFVIYCSLDKCLKRLSKCRNMLFLRREAGP